MLVIVWEWHNIGLALLCGCSGVLEHPKTNSCGKINESLILILIPFLRSEHNACPIWHWTQTYNTISRPCSLAVGANAACNRCYNFESVHQVPIMAGNMKFTWHFYTWQALGIEPQTLWSWMQCSMYFTKCSQYHVKGYKFILQYMLDVEVFSKWPHTCMTLSINNQEE